LCGSHSTAAVNELHTTADLYGPRKAKVTRAGRKTHNEELSFTANHTECYYGYEINTIGQYKAKKTQDAKGSVIQ